MIFTPYYQINDDTFKIFYTQGVGSELAPTDFAGYSNPLWGLILKTLFAAFPDTPWYGILITSVQILSLGAILYSLRLGEHARFKAFLFVVSFFCAFHVFFSDLQYTVTSSLAAQAGLFICAALWQNRASAPSPGGWWIAGFFFFVSSIIRLESFALTVFCALPFLVYFHLKETGKSRGTFWVSKKTFLASIFLLVAGGAVYNFFWYQKDPGWREFNQFDHERVELQDYRIDPYNERTGALYQAAGWTYNDFVMFKTWYYMDEDIFSTARMRELKKHFPRIGAEGKPDTYHSLPELLSSSGARVFLVCLLAFALFVPKTIFHVLFLQIAWILIILTLLIYILRAPDRVLMPLLAWAIGVSMFLAVSPLAALRRMSLKGGRWVQWAGVFLLVLCLLLGGRSYLNSYSRNQEKVKNEEILRADLQRLDPKDNELYVIWDSSFPYESLNAFDNFHFFRKFHLLVLAVYQRSPLAKKTMEHFGMKHPLRDLVDNPRFSLICTPQEGALYRVYMGEKYGMEIYPEKTFDSAFFKVFRIHSKPVKKAPRGETKPGK